MNIHVGGVRRDPVALGWQGVLVTAAILLVANGPALAQSLTLAEAERLAVGQDASVKSLEAHLDVSLAVRE